MKNKQETKTVARAPFNMGAGSTQRREQRTTVGAAVGSLLSFLLLHQYAV